MTIDNIDVAATVKKVHDIDIRRVVTEYRAEILQDQHGQRYTAPFPAHVTKAVQYGNDVKAQAVYLSQYQLIPYQRVQEQFQDQLQLPISAIAPASLKAPTVGALPPASMQVERGFRLCLQSAGLCVTGAVRTETDRQAARYPRVA